MDHQLIKSFFIISYVLAASVCLTLGDVSELKAQQHFWKTKLPNTPIPQALLDVLPSQGNDDRHTKYDGRIPMSQKVDENGYEPPTHKSFLKQDVATSIFILEKDLTPGVNLNIHFTHMSRDTYPPFPSSNLTKKLPPFSSNNLPELLRFFSISPTSKAAKILSETLARCEHPNPMNGLVQFCATSLEKMVTSVTQNLGNSRNIKAVSAERSQTDKLMPYRVESVHKIAEGRSLLACHQLSFPYGVYYCHQPKGAAIFSVPLVRVSDGVKLNAYAMCHYSTSEWNDAYIAFTVLGQKPGDTVCHFFQPDNVIFYRN